MYKRVKQLNGKYSRASGAITTIDKKSNSKKEDRFASFIRINDCHNTVYLHPSENIHYSKKAKKSYIKKIQRLKNEIDRYLEHLQKL